LGYPIAIHTRTKGTPLTPKLVSTDHRWFCDSTLPLIMTRLMQLLYLVLELSHRITEFRNLRHVTGHRWRKRLHTRQHGQVHRLDCG